jgi:hypothetical protein
MKRMKVFGVKFGGVWIGGYGVVIAEDAEAARTLFMANMPKGARPECEVEISRIDTREPSVTILSNGDY